MEIQTKGFKYYRKSKKEPLECRATLKHKLTISGRKVIELSQFVEIIGKLQNKSWECDKDFMRPIVRYILVDDYRTNLALAVYSEFKGEETCFVEISELQELTNENRVTLVVENVL